MIVRCLGHVLNRSTFMVMLQSQQYCCGLQTVTRFRHKLKFLPLEAITLGNDGVI